MRLTTAVVCWNLFLTLAVCISTEAQGKRSEFTRDSWRQFAQEFYAWYVPNTHVKEIKKNGMPALDFALKNSRSAFDPELVRELEEGEAQAKRDREPFLNFEPVLNTQDPAPPL